MIYLFATEMEARNFRALSPESRVVICGVGAAECAAATAYTIMSMRELHDEQMLILAGIAGSYSLDDVALCDVVEVLSEEIAALPQRFAQRYVAASQTLLRGVSSTSVNGAGEVANPTTQIENMEGAAFMAVCQRLGAKCLQIRSISNKVGDPFHLWNVDEACERLAQSLKEVSINLADAIGK